MAQTSTERVRRHRARQRAAAAAAKPEPPVAAPAPIGSPRRSPLNVAERSRRYRARKRAARDAAQVDIFSLRGPSSFPTGTEGRQTWPARPGRALAAWAKANLVVPYGLLAGQPFELQDWQIEFLDAALQPEIREGVLSTPRKSGKSATLAALMLGSLHRTGPFHKQEWRGLVVSEKAALAKELRMQVASTAAASGLDGIIERVSPTPGRVLGHNGAVLDILSADKSSGHATGVDLACIDELGIFSESDRGLVNAAFSSVSGRDGRFLAISIKGDSPFMKELAERAAAGSKGLFYREYSAPPNCPIEDEAAWHQANPSLGTIKSLAYMRDAARRAACNPADERHFRSYDLNQPLSPERETIVSVSDWGACKDLPVPPRRGVCTVGLDLGGSSSMTALAAFWPSTGRIEVYGAFPASPPLHERAREDGVGALYEQMRDAGELSIIPGRHTDVPTFLGFVRARLGNVQVGIAGADRYRRAECLQALETAGVRWRMEFRGMGAGAIAEGSRDVREFQKIVLARGLRPGDSLMLEHAVSESAVRYDVAGNPALEKGRSRGRIDALSAAVIAVGLAAKHERHLRAPRATRISIG